jgi:ATP-dependent Lon protease
VYPTNNKVEIARRYLVPKQAEEHGLESDQFVVTDDALEDVAGSYTREAGVRGLDRVIAKLARKTVRRLVEEEETAVIDRDDLGDLLGPIPFRAKSAEAADAVGVTTGLAVTGVGGDVLFVEAALVEGSGKLTLTGQLGDVMRESAQAVATYARSRVAQNPSGSVAELDGWFDRTDVHLHVPDGAVLKDGPSAGVTMTTSLVSALTSTPVRANVAMTGEVPLRGNVLPIGGVKDKVLAAHLAGIDTVLLPADNAKDLVDIPEEIREQMDIRLVAHMDEVLEYALAT